MNLVSSLLKDCLAQAWASPVASSIGSLLTALGPPSDLKIGDRRFRIVKQVCGPRVGSYSLVRFIMHWGSPRHLHCEQAYLYAVGTVVAGAWMCRASALYIRSYLALAIWQLLQHFAPRMQ